MRVCVCVWDSEPHCVGVSLRGSASSCVSVCKYSKNQTIAAYVSTNIHMYNYRQAHFRPYNTASSTSIYICVYVSTNMCMYVFVCVCVWIHVCSGIYTRHTCLHTYIHTQLHTHAHTKKATQEIRSQENICTHKRKHVHTCTHSHTHTNNHCAQVSRNGNHQHGPDVRGIQQHQRARGQWAVWYASPGWCRCGFAPLYFHLPQQVYIQKYVLRYVCKCTYLYVCMYLHICICICICMSVWKYQRF